MTARNWDKARDRSRIGRQGAESVGTKVRRRSVAQEAAAAEIVTKILRCQCGHRGKIELPAAMLAGRHFKCTACGRRIG